MIGKSSWITPWRNPCLEKFYWSLSARGSSKVSTSKYLRGRSERDRESDHSDLSGFLLGRRNGD
jgi:hypothetical protein